MFNPISNAVAMNDEFSIEVLENEWVYPILQDDQNFKSAKPKTKAEKEAINFYKALYKHR